MERNSYKATHLQQSSEKISSGDGYGLIISGQGFLDFIKSHNTWILGTAMVRLKLTDTKHVIQQEFRTIYRYLHVHMNQPKIMYLYDFRSLIRAQIDFIEIV